MATGRLSLRPSRPTPSRHSVSIGPAKTMSASSFQAPPDYIGPRKSRLSNPPETSLNPKRNSFPIVSVSKLDVRVTVPPTSQTSLPLLKHHQIHACNTATFANTLFEDKLARNILKNMPAVFRKQFRPELQRLKKPPRKKPHFDFHELCPAEEPVLHGILLVGGDHRDRDEEEAPEPGTPPPLSGRQHCNVQTDIYLENVGDDESELISSEVQCDPIDDEEVEPPPLLLEKEGEASTGTQLDLWTFANMDEIYGQMAANLTDTVVMESLKQLQEEYELQVLQKQRDMHQQLVNEELAILEKHKEALAKYEAQQKYLESRKPWEETLDQIIQLVGFDKIQDLAPEHFIGAQTDQAIFKHVQQTVIPPVNEETVKKFGLSKQGRDILDDIIDETIMKREAEYAGKMFVRDPRFKVSLASGSISKFSVGDRTIMDDGDIEREDLGESGWIDDDHLLLAQHDDSQHKINWEDQVEHFEHAEHFRHSLAEEQLRKASNGSSAISEEMSDVSTIRGSSNASDGARKSAGSAKEMSGE